MGLRLLQKGNRLNNTDQVDFSFDIVNELALIIPFMLIIRVHSLRQNLRQCQRLTSVTFRSLL